MNTVWQTILPLSLSGTALALILLSLRGIMHKRLPSTFYYYAWLVVLLRFLIPVPGLLPMAASSVETPTETEVTLATAQERTQRPYQQIVQAEDASDEKPEEEQEYQTDAVLPAPSLEVEVVEEEANEQPTTGIFLSQAKAFLTSAPFWTMVWAVGAIGCAAWYVIGYLCFSRCLRKTMLPPRKSDLALYVSIPAVRKPDISRSSFVDTPMLLGILKPVIVLPDRDYADETLENILHHELTHYRRGDIAYKWLAVLTFSLHWFNPFTWLFRRELDRACELSCDEHLLRHMSPGEKQKYGEMLLTLAAKQSLPKRVVATTFATEKRNLKERLEQIMTYKNKGRAGLAVVLAGLLLLCGCAAALGPQAAPLAESDTADAQSEGTTETLEDTATVFTEDAQSEGTTATSNVDVTVSTVDELLAAIAPGTTVTLNPGVYDLSTASDYGAEETGDWYTWEMADLSGDGFELVITGVDNFAIVGADAESVTICAVPRLADVLTLRDCAGITISGITAGHTEEPGMMCIGGVVALEDTDDVSISDCVLYGCGVRGITATNCGDVVADSTVIKECSDGAVTVESCNDVRLQNCQVYDCGEDAAGCQLFHVMTSYGFAVVNSEIHDNNTDYLLRNEYSQETYILGSSVENNDIEKAMFALTGYDAVVDSCSFTGNEVEAWYPDDQTLQAVTPEGEGLDEADLEAMTLAEATYDGPEEIADTSDLITETTSDGKTVVHVTTVDEFLASIASDTTIYLDAETFDLSTAAAYGAYGGDNYYWVNCPDGAGLVITGVSNLTICGEGASDVTICAVPRYANVLAFESCENIALSGFTAGHTEEPGACTGGVLHFQNTSGVDIENCCLYGCGILGIAAYQCSDMDIQSVEIYDCSQGAVRLEGCADVSFTGCDIHDCGTPTFNNDEFSTNITLDGMDMPIGVYNLP